MFNSGGWRGSIMKGLNTRMNVNIKSKKGNIGMHKAGLIDCNFIDISWHYGT